MKKQLTFIPVAFAILLFMIAQFFIVRQIWQQKDEVFKIKYRAGSQEAIDNLMYDTGETGFDYALWLVDYYSKEHIENSKTLPTKYDSVAFQIAIRKGFTETLTSNQDLSSHLSYHFEKLGLEKDFKIKIYVNEIYLINFSDKYHVYSASKNERKKQLASGNVLINTFVSERNSFRIIFDYYIDIADKEAIILRDLAITFALSLFSLLILATIFIVTLKNYLKEKRLSNLKTDFINNMTHELKTPLSTITVAGKTLTLDGILNSKEKIVETANLIGKQSIQLNNLINLILEISMWERTQFQVDLKESELEEVLSDLVDAFINGSGKYCSFSSNIQLNGAKADIDTVYFTTMINNLLNNAIKYSGDNKEISISAKVDDNIVISISDNGLGIRKSDQKYIFDKFYRVGTGNIHKVKGLGLGLYYVKRIANAHKGDVSVSSKKGKGSSFIITLPKKN